MQSRPEPPGREIASQWAPVEHVRIGGLWVATASRGELVQAALHDAAISDQPRRPRLVFYVNSQGLSMAASDLRHREDLLQCDILHADGGFLVTASRLLTSRKIAERSAVTDLIHDMAGAGDGRLSFYLLGAREEDNAKAARALEQAYPKLRIAGRRNGYFSIEDEGAIVADINRARPDILWVGMGKPLQEAFCVRNRHRLDCVWIVACGGCFDFLSGRYRRAPQWMQDANLEWLHRLVTRPRDLFWRYLTTIPHAIWLTLTRSGKGRRTRGAKPDPAREPDAPAPA